MTKRLCGKYGISKIFSAPYHPRGNSIVETYMRSLKSTLRLCVCAFRQDWDLVLPAAALAYRSTPHVVTKYSPYFMVTGQEIVLPLSRSWKEPTLALHGAKRITALWRCRAELVKAHRRIDEDNRRALMQDPKRLTPGMHVALKLTPAEKRAAGKFSPLFKGPLVVRESLANGASASLYDPATGKEMIANRARLKVLEVPPALPVAYRALPRLLFE